MGYQALLFCPDEKTARTVTQVLSELDFTIEPCSEPFAAVKKLTTQHFDAVVAMYHDQGLAPLKYASFGHGVNVTLGLPLVRTSVDHGTALDLVGTGRADPASMLAAIELAAQLAANQSSLSPERETGPREISPLPLAGQGQG